VEWAKCGSIWRQFCGFMYCS